MPHSSNPTRAAQGFALLEVAIVLVIIGLLLGGFLVGKDLVTNARAKSLATWVRGWE